MKNKLGRLLLLFFGVLFFIAGCDQHYSPKPRGWFRIDLPEKEYQLFDSLTNFTFQKPVYARVTDDSYNRDETDWVNLDFGTFQAVIHLSYKSVDHNLNEFVEDARMLALKHLPKANAISDTLLSFPDNKVYGVLYQIGGKGVASPLQFYLTDSTSHFVRGALYFNARPNNDSIAPVIDFLKADVLHFAQSLQWK